MDIYSMPAAVRNIPIEKFPLPIRIFRKLEAAGISNYEEIVNTLRAGQSLLNKKQKDEVKSMVTSFHDSIEEGEPNWEAFCESYGITILPQKTPTVTDAEIFGNLSSIFEEILTFDQSDEKKWTVLQYRFGLNGKKMLTLDELGQAHRGLTRERVRQIEASALGELRDALLNEKYIDRFYFIDRRVVKLVQDIRESLRRVDSDFTAEEDLIRNLTTDFSVPHNSDLYALRLLLQLFGVTQITDLPEGVPIIWKINKDFPNAKLKKALLKIRSVLTTDYVPPMDDIELLSKINRAMGRTESLSTDDLRKYITLCDFVETMEDGRYQAKFEKISSRVGQAERLLVEAGEPVDVKELVQRLNQRLVAAGLNKVEYLNIANVMSTDKRFVAEASSGRRALKRWNTDTKTVIEQMMDALIAFDRPASPEEIFTYVKERRPVSLNSIKMYLTNDNRFVSSGYGKWQLSSWKSQNGETPDIKTEIGEAVIEEFDRLGVGEMPYPKIVEFLAQKLNINSNQARGTLRHHPVVKSRRIGNSNKTTAILNRSYKTDLANTQPSERRRKETLYQKAEKLVKEMLTQDPSKEVELHYLRAKLVSDLGLQKQTAYQYISKMAFVEKLPVEGTTVQICRFKNNHTAAYPKIAEIKRINAVSGEEAQRAVYKLNETEVDIGLFMLGRLFENSLKSFLLEVRITRAYRIEHEDTVKLNDMIRWIKRQKIVSDAPTLSYLQTMRNERAHGKAPSLEERKRLLESAPWGANMYLTYILFFEQKRAEVLSQQVS